MFECETHTPLCTQGAHTPVQHRRTCTDGRTPRYTYRPPLEPTSATAECRQMSQSLLSSASSQYDTGARTQDESSGPTNEQAGGMPWKSTGVVHAARRTPFRLATSAFSECSGGIAVQGSCSSDLQLGQCTVCAVQTSFLRLTVTNAYPPPSPTPHTHTLATTAAVQCHVMLTCTVLQRWVVVEFDATSSNHSRDRLR